MVELFGLEPSPIILLILNCASAVISTRCILFNMCGSVIEKLNLIRKYIHAASVFASV